MSERQDQNLFRKKAMNSISSPEDLTSYLRVTSPGMWIILAAVIALLAGIFAWAAVGTLETTEDATAIVQDHTAKIIPTGQWEYELEEGMFLKVASKEFAISTVEYDKYGRATAKAEVSLPDGTYKAKVIVEQTKPIEFLLESR